MTLSSIIFVLVMIMNPLGNIPVFLATLKSVDPTRHTKIILREVFFAFLLLVLFMFFGEYVLHSIQISEQALGMSGGIIIFIIALRMIFPEEKVSTETKKVVEPFIVPLAIPITVGPGALTAVMLLATQHPDKKPLLVIGIIISIIIVGTILVGSRIVNNVLGEKGLIALERLSGMILTGMAVQMFISGVDAYFKLH